MGTLGWSLGPLGSTAVETGGTGVKIEDIREKFGTCGGIGVNPGSIGVEIGDIGVEAGAIGEEFGATGVHWGQ